MGLFKFARDAGERVGDALTDNWFTNIFKGKDKDDDRDELKPFRIDASNVTAEQKGERVILKGRARTQAEAEKMIIAAGNRRGVSEVESHIEVDEQAPVSRFYEVKSGDTLSKISKEYYGDPMKYSVIFDANRPLLTDPDKIYPGQVLRIPDLQKAA